MRSSTGSGRAPGPALKLNARFALRSVAEVGCTIVEILDMNFVTFRRNHHHSPERLEYQKSACAGHVRSGSRRGMKSNRSAIIVNARIANGDAPSTRRAPI